MALKTSCPSCHASDPRPFYEASGVPVESSVVLTTRDDAVDFPTGDVVLGFCPRCGFIANLAAPDETPAPSADTEDQQGFSPTFTAFAERTAALLTARYQLEGKTIVEIGCGKGDFLARLCAGGANTGVGIDPLFDGRRLPPGMEAVITALPERYRREHRRLQPHLIVCRHTLEHIPAVGEMLDTIRATLDPGRDTAVVIEVPDVGRILDEGAFWDVYFEHTSYFSAGTLARALRRSDHEVTDLSRAYGDQYLIVHARAARENAAGDTFAAEESVQELSVRVDAFADRARDAVVRWRERVGDRPVIWGSGSKCVAFAATLGIADRVAGVVDVNPHRHGRFMPGIGRAIMAPENLRRDPPRAIVAMNPIYREEIEASVRALGLDSEVLALS